MSSETTAHETSTDQTVGVPMEMPITLRIVFSAMAGGFVGTVLMLPVLVGIPSALGLFQTEPITNFAGFAEFFGIDPTLTLGVALFGVGGVLLLPLVFVVVGAFLPPQSPRALRGVTFATIFWSGFVPAFWPPGDALVVAFYLLFSLAGHWVYGAALGYILHRTSGIPQHRV